MTLLWGAACLAILPTVRAPAQSMPNLDLPLLEAPPWLAKPVSGPHNAKGVVYFLRGGNPSGPFDSFSVAPYFLKTLSDRGWDVIQAKFPYAALKNSVAEADARALAAAAGQFVVRRIRELRNEGYRRVVLAGHGSGSFLAMAIVRSDAARPDVLVLHSPNRFGAKTVPGGKPNPRYGENFTQFAALLDSVRIPTILITFSDPIGLSLDGIGMTAAAHLVRNSVPHMIIDKPAAFTGHHAGWLPIFDYVYEDCINMFLDRATTNGCALPAGSTRITRMNH